MPSEIFMPKNTGDLLDYRYFWLRSTEMWNKLQWFSRAWSHRTGFNTLCCTLLILQNVPDIQTGMNYPGGPIRKLWFGKCYLFITKAGKLWRLLGYRTHQLILLEYWISWHPCELTVTVLRELLCLSSSTSDRVWLEKISVLQMTEHRVRLLYLLPQHTKTSDIFQIPQYAAGLLFPRQHSLLQPYSRGCQTRTLAKKFYNNHNVQYAAVLP